MTFVRIPEDNRPKWPIPEYTVLRSIRSPQSPELVPNHVSCMEAERGRKASLPAAANAYVRIDSAVGDFDVWLSNRCRYTKFRRFSQGGVEQLDFCSGINFYAMSTKRGRL